MGNWMHAEDNRILYGRPYAQSNTMFHYGPEAIRRNSSGTRVYHRFLTFKEAHFVVSSDFLSCPSELSSVC